LLRLQYLLLVTAALHLAELMYRHGKPRAQAEYMAGLMKDPRFFGTFLPLVS
jgi:hypothetical protein